MSEEGPMVDPREELAELLADLRATMDQASLQGARLFPREPFLPPGELPLAGWEPGGRAGAPPRREDRGPSPRSGAGPAGGPSSPRRPDPPPRQGTPPRPTFQRPTAASPPPTRPLRPSAPRSGPPAQPPAQGAAPGQQQSSLGAWGRFRKPAGPVPSAPSEVPPGSDLARVREILGDCRRCGLCEGRQNIVFGVGSPRARVVVVGEAPGAQEDRQGEPFVGKAGQMLDRMVANVLGLERSEIYIANVVKCRPPENRNPEPEEIAACQPFLRAQLEAVEPELILVLGRVAAQTLFQTSRGITRLRGEWRLLDLGGRKVPAMCTFHPAYLLRRPEEKRKTFQDLKAMRARLDGLSPP